MSPRDAPRRRGRTLAIAGCVAIVVLAAAGVGSYFLLRSHAFAVTTVIVTGERHESYQQVVNVAGLAHDPPIATLDTTRIAQRLAGAFPWIQSAAVQARWPHTVEIRLTERTAVALVAGPRGTLVLVDRTGRRLGAPGRGQALPVLSYAPSPGTVVTTSGQLPRAAAPGLIVAATLPPAFGAQVAAVQVDPRGWVTLKLASPVTFLLGPPSDLGAKYEDVAAVIARTTLHAGDVVDVSVPQSITVSGP